MGSEMCIRDRLKLLPSWAMPLSWLLSCPRPATKALLYAASKPTSVYVTVAACDSSFSSTIDAGGALDFGFLSNGLGALWGNGSANVGVMLSADRQSALLLFNDSYADNDFDDMVVRVTIAAVPEPETLAMLLSGLGVVMVGARRRARKMAAAQAV